MILNSLGGFTSMLKTDTQTRIRNSITREIPAANTDTAANQTSEQKAGAGCSEHRTISALTPKPHSYNANADSQHAEGSCHQPTHGNGDEVAVRDVDLGDAQDVVLAARLDERREPVQVPLHRGLVVRPPWRWRRVNSVCWNSEN